MTFLAIAITICVATALAQGKAPPLPTSSETFSVKAKGFSVSEGFRHMTLSYDHNNALLEADDQSQLFTNSMSYEFTKDSCKVGKHSPPPSPFSRINNSSYFYSCTLTSGKKGQFWQDTSSSLCDDSCPQRAPKFRFCYDGETPAYLVQRDQGHDDGIYWLYNYTTAKPAPSTFAVPAICKKTTASMAKPKSHPLLAF
eukprot:NODE_5565_length_932_cov_68.846724_g5342_i0.p1 GENE.NODE_5565_length_932_cov_68.846724_g5342_i0~~NODE_5565_length_932_cov_68.846724_g5342_i0.p1  ORF type:complete len:217 (-),score=50.60 NODE_5565_length_932_cov_68.846724_g5342_i0:281-874(-)